MGDHRRGVARGSSGSMGVGLEAGGKDEAIGGGDMKTITPFLWSNDQAEEAASFYVTVFSNLGGGHGTAGGETSV
jgi:3-demethylubiquinone-9 3-methyltransferase